MKCLERHVQLYLSRFLRPVAVDELRTSQCVFYRFLFERTGANSVIHRFIMHRFGQNMIETQRSEILTSTHLHACLQWRIQGGAWCDAPWQAVTDLQTVEELHYLDKVPAHRCRKKHWRSGDVSPNTPVFPMSYLLVLLTDDDDDNDVDEWWCDYWVTLSLTHLAIR